MSPFLSITPEGLVVSKPDAAQQVQRTPLLLATKCQEATSLFFQARPLLAISQGLVSLRDITPTPKAGVTPQGLRAMACRGEHTHKWTPGLVTAKNNPLGKMYVGIVEGNAKDTHFLPIFFPRRTSIQLAGGSGPTAHWVPVFALLGGEHPLLPLTPSAGFGCLQLELLFQPARLGQ